MNLSSMFQFIGYMAERPEVEKTRSGISKVEFSLPTSSQRKDADGNYQTEWHKVTAYGQIADNIAQKNGKGDLVQVVGNVQEDRWKTDKGETRYKTVFVVDSFRTLKYAEKRYENYGDDRKPKEPVYPEGDDLPF